MAREAERVVNNPNAEVKNLRNGRTAYWDNETGTVVVHDPNKPDQGTIFKPKDGKEYFDKELK